ncbi:hypothetical protein ACR8AL_15185 [Clavibacter sepedonicus]|uniref:Membrane protein n=1 Tax=Clavibacter sepedonicus TaxID=31964 RepID=B0RC80_CLASE|nr:MULTISPECIES: hypothetical protein [Clavibacter]MBD5381419.1 hypothetical protein [Clavibacter sp.]OQJ48480.1 hypothetical protein B5P19_09540 [Clavibacter sepedonicus]OQJ53961.1 hypothetical protein B5P20_07380 [Clavibacter sepedonicus]UUK65486.1 hypothetical protein LRE50_14620 [Clavibacter sepedonicus]CAQ02966.1 putative membrane protein [Clavibacter sepedonicus]
MLPLFFSAVGQVALVALLLGAGLPALFALGVRSFALASPDTSGRVAGSDSSRRTPPIVLQVAGALCYAVVVLAVIAGLTLIIATGLGQSVSFEHVIPTFTSKG